MVLLISLILDGVLAAAALVKRKGINSVCRLAAMSAIVNGIACYVSMGLEAELGASVLSEIACAAGAKIFMIWIFLQKEKTDKQALTERETTERASKEEIFSEALPVYLVSAAVSLCVHSHPIKGVACELILLCYILFFERNRRKKGEREAGDRTGLNAGLSVGGDTGRNNGYLQTIEESYRKNRALMHDLNNHAVAMRALAESGKYEELVRYTDTFSRKVRENIFPVHSGSIVLDALLADKYHRAAARDIPILFEEIRYSADLDDEDLCIVLGNLLDNAIEENEKCADPGQRRIFLRIVSEEDSLNIRVRNPLFHELTVKGGLPVSQKPDAEHHGMGLRNVRRVCDRYGGTLFWDVSEKEFSVTAELIALSFLLFVWFPFYF